MKRAKIKLSAIELIEASVKGSIENLYPLEDIMRCNKLKATHENRMDVGQEVIRLLKEIGCKYVS